MTASLLTLATIALSSAAVAYLAFHDPKRRRVFAEPARQRSPRRALAWTLAYLPGVLLLVFDQWAAFMMWLGGAPLMGWMVVSRRPDFYRGSCSWLHSLTLQCQRLRQADRAETLRWLRGGAVRHAIALRNPSRKVADLEARVAELERLVHDRSPLQVSDDPDAR